MLLVTRTYEAQSRVIVPTTFAVFRPATFVQNKKGRLARSPELDCQRGLSSWVAVLGPDFASGDTFRALPCVGDDDNMTSRTRPLAISCAA